MKTNYYLIEVTTHTSVPGTANDHPSYGYFTSEYRLNKGFWVGSDSNPEYERVKRYKTERMAEAKVLKLRQQHYGDSSVSVDYDFKVVQLQLEPLDSEIETKIEKRYKLIGKDIVRDTLINHLKDELEEFYNNNSNKYTSDEMNKITQSVNYYFTKMIKSTGK